NEAAPTSPRFSVASWSRVQRNRHNPICAPVARLPSLRLPSPRHPLSHAVQEGEKRVRTWPLLVVCVVSLPASVRLSASAAPALPEAGQAALGRADSLVRARQVKPGFAIYDSLVRAADLSGEPEIKLKALGSKGGFLAFFGQPREAEPILRDAVRMSRDL